MQPDLTLNCVRIVIVILIRFNINTGYHYLLKNVKYIPFILVLLYMDFFYFSWSVHVRSHNCYRLALPLRQETLQTDSNFTLRSQNGDKAAFCALTIIRYCLEFWSGNELSTYTISLGDTLFFCAFIYTHTHTEQ